MSERVSTVARLRITKLRLLSITALALMVCAGTLLAMAMSGTDLSREERLSASIMTSIDSFTVTPSTVYVGEEVTFVASGSSTVGSELTFTFYYDAIDAPWPTNNTESPVSVHTTDNPGTVTTTFTYDRLGNLTSGSKSYYVVRLFVSDGVEAKNTTRTVYVIQNTAPSFVLSLPSTIQLLPDEEIDLSIVVSDVDDDPVTVTWDFGDGTVVVNNTDNALAGQYVSQTHAWSPEIGPGMGPLLYYSLVVTLEDPYSNTKVSTTTVAIELPPNGLPVLLVRVSSNTVDPDEDVTVYANATDPEGEALTWTYVINNSIQDIAVFVSHTDATDPSTKVWSNLTYAFPEPGSYNVRVYVSDALIPYQIPPHNVTKSVQVYVVGNAIPSIVDEIVMSELSPTIDTALGYEIVTFTVQTYDNDGDVLTVTWDMDDGGDPPVNVSSGGLVIYTFRQDRVFTVAGTYNISVTVTDGIAGHEVGIYKIVNVTTNNLPPNILEFDFSYSTGDFALPGESIEFTVTLSDPEMDSLELIWDFGDNTSLVFVNVTEYVAGVATCVVNHSYETVGVYNLTMFYTDNQIGQLNHTKVKEVTVTVDTLYVRVVEDWSWWDYTSLSLVIGVPVLFILTAYHGYLKRRRVESEGISWEEKKLRESEMLDAQEDDFYKEVD